jgi:hypothetical protein
MALNRLRSAGPHLLRTLQAFSSKTWLGTVLGVLVFLGGGCHYDFENYASVVTQYEFELLMNQNPSNNSACGGGCPVESVTWHQAALYCSFLSLNLGYDTCYTCSGVWPNISCDLDIAYTSPYECPGYRLPTEAEWEYAARAGTTAATYNGNLQAGKLGCEQPNSTLDSIAWFCGNCGNTLQRVGLKDPNPWDLYDMLGGVWEWCHDWYENYPSTAVEDPWGSTPSSGRMVRGGSWYNPAANARAAQRLPVDPSSVFINVGIRPVRTLNP